MNPRNGVRSLLKFFASAVAAGLLTLLAGLAHAQETPEAVYQQFHKASKAADASAMAKVSTPERAKEISDSWWIERKILASMTPDTYKITSKQASTDGNRVQLRGAAMYSVWGSEEKMMYGIIDLVRIKNEWKVDKVGWANDEWPEEKLN
jgi:hypothetical protein